MSEVMISITPTRNFVFVDGKDITAFTRDLSIHLEANSLPQVQITLNPDTLVVVQHGSHVEFQETKNA